MKKNNLINLIILIATIYHISTYSMLRKTLKPKSFPKSELFNISKASSSLSFTPASSTNIASFLSKQPDEIQRKINNYPVLKEFIIEVNQNPNLQIIDYAQPKLDNKTLAKLEIFIYCINHPDKTEEIMSFYEEMEKAHKLITNRLKFLPNYAQEFFKNTFKEITTNDINENLSIEDIKNLNIKEIKARILLLRYTIVIAVVGVSLHSLALLIDFFNYYYEYSKYEALSDKYMQEKDILETFEILTDALNLEPTGLYKNEKNDYYKNKDTAIAFYSQATKCIVLNPSFFNYSTDSQLFTLLHELRHYQQHTQIRIPEDVIEYAKKCGVSEKEESLWYFFSTTFFWSSALGEFDADLFAARQMKDYRWINSITQEMGWTNFDPKKGYLSKEMILKESPHGNKSLFITKLEKAWERFIGNYDSSMINKIPQHLKDAAIKNKTAREEKKEEREKIFKDYSLNF